MSQTSINKAGQPVAVAGQLSDNGEVVDLVSRINAEASAVLPFGIGAKAGTSRNGVNKPSTTADVIEGVVVFDFSHQPGATGDVDQTQTPPGLKPNAKFNLLRKGRIWVPLDSTVTVITPNSDRTFLRVVSHVGVGTVVGYWTNVSDPGDTIDLTKVGVFVSGLQTSADGTTLIAEAEFDFTSKP